ncbi:hypothetical protein BJX61DRAFT_551200 [Aspergillus egyptiacus]|nr:hypothetical protein BJX61DRAFT_551200 [Aspergillus egyptiacus]
MPSSKSRLPAPGASDHAAHDVQKRRKNVGTACLACKSRKLKCTGAPPCANCVKSRIECTLDETADKRRRGALKRRIDHLEYNKDLLHRIRNVLCDNTRYIPLLNLIRSHASLAEIRFYIEHQLPRSGLNQSPELADIYRELEQSVPSEPLPKRRILDTRRPSELPRFSVPAHPWTSVVADDVLVSRLVSLWFTWVHPFCNWIDRDLFIRDMKSGSLSAQYCSPFLVNIMLADACAYADYQAGYGLPEDLASRRTEFYEEAKRCLHKEEGRISLAMVQGLGLLWLCASITGRDRQGWISRGKLAYALRELSQVSSSPAGRSDADSVRLIHVISHTHWGLFNLAMLYSIFVRKAPIVSPPRQSSLPQFAGHQCDQDTWCAYPNQANRVESHTSCLFNALCGLNRITYQLHPFLFPKEGAPLPGIAIDNEELEALQNLSEWSDRLPQCLQEKNMDIPHVLTLHTYYHTILTAVYGFLRAHPVHNQNLIPRNPQVRDAILSPSYAWDLCLSSSRKIAQLTLVHRSNWGFDRMPGPNIHCIMAALFVLLEALDDPANRDAFISLTITAGTFFRRWKYTKGLLRALQDTARQRGITLPPETGPFFLDLDQVSDSMTPGKSETPD